MVAAPGGCSPGDTVVHADPIPNSSITTGNRSPIGAFLGSPWPRLVARDHLATTRPARRRTTHTSTTRIHSAHVIFDGRHSLAILVRLYRRTIHPSVVPK